MHVQISRSISSKTKRHAGRLSEGAEVDTGLQGAGEECRPTLGLPKLSAMEGGGGVAAVCCQALVGEFWKPLHICSAPQAGQIVP